MKLPISIKELQEILTEYNGSIVTENTRYTRIIVCNNIIIDVYLNSGTFVNTKTKYKSKGRFELIQYIKYLSNLKTTKSVSTNNLEERVKQLEERINSLELTIQKYFQDKPEPIDLIREQYNPPF